MESMSDHMERNGDPDEPSLLQSLVEHYGKQRSTFCVLKDTETAFVDSERAQQHFTVISQVPEVSQIWTNDENHKKCLDNAKITAEDEGKKFLMCLLYDWVIKVEETALSEVSSGRN